MLTMQICSHHGVNTNPEERDAYYTAEGIRSVSEFITKYFKGVAKAPSMVEPCMYTVRADWSVFELLLLFPVVCRRLRTMTPFWTDIQSILMW